MRQRAMTLSIYTITDNSHFAPKTPTHTHSNTHNTGTECRGINSLHHVINPILPPTVTKEHKTFNKGKLKHSGLNTMLISPSSCHPVSLMLSFYVTQFFSSFPPLLLPHPLFINLSSTAASARPNWWVEALSHIEVSLHNYTCIDAEGVILAGLHCTKSASYNVAAVACITPSWSN